MKKTYYNKQGKPVHISHAKRKDGRVELNPSALSPVELMNNCELFTYESANPQSKSNVLTKPGKLVFNDKTGTCTHEQIELTSEEIAAREEHELRAEFEAEQFEREEQEREEKFKAWKAKKEKNK
jgi:hypothetical protein